MKVEEVYWDIMNKWETLHGWEGNLYVDKKRGHSIESPIEDVVGVIDFAWFMVMQDFGKVMANHEA